MTETALFGAAIILVQAAMLYGAWSLSSRLRILRRIEVSQDDPVLPDVCIMHDKPYIFPIGKRKALYLQPLSHEMHRRFLRLYTAFLATIGNELAGLRLLQSVDDQATREEVIEKWRKVAFSRQANAGLKRLFCDVFLKDRRMNPDRIGWRTIKRLRWDDVMFIWQMASARNLEAVEDFINALLVRLADPQGRAKPGSNSQKSAGSRLTPQYDSRCQPRSSSQSEQASGLQENTMR